VSELDDKIVDEFLVDSYEGLDRLDRDLVEIESAAGSSAALVRAFRTLHTIKGTCSFFGFRRLERIAHAGENLLARLRSSEIAPSPAVTRVLLAVSDTVRGILSSIETTRAEAPGDDTAVLEQIAVLVAGDSARVEAAAAPPAAAAAPTAPAEPPPAPAAPAAGVEAADDGTLQRANVRVDVRVLDGLVNLVGELVLARNQIVQHVGRQDWTALQASAQRLNHVTSRLQEETMRTRMQPISTLWTRLPRLVRDVADACGKQVVLHMEGTHTELDKTLVEALKDPLVHLVRNAVDHGIEPPATRVAAGKPAEGRLVLRAWHEGGQVHLEVSDDGAGLPVERIRERAIERGLVTREEAAALGERDWIPFVFRPGFSTASGVTSVSGRGVGMDVVRSNLERVGGSIDLWTQPGAGTRVRLRIPLTLAILPALMVEDAGERYAIPQMNLVELVRVSARDLASRIEWLHDAPVYRLRGRLLPIVFLGGIMRGLPAREATGHGLVVLRAEGRAFGLVVDAVHDTEEIVVKPLSERLRGLEVFAGATLLGDGSVSLILDVPALARLAGVCGAEETGPVTSSEPAGRSLLLVELCGGGHAAVPLVGIARIDELPADAFEPRAGHAAARWRGEVLPVAPLAPAGGTAEYSLVPGQLYPVIVGSDGERRFGWVVESIADVITIEGALPAGERTLLGDRITDVVELSPAFTTRFAPARAGALRRAA
jgi:two-component system chemotaxis sensor kinase CheA